MTLILHRRVHLLTTQTIIAFIEQLSGHPLNADEGIWHGSAEREVRRAQVCWMATRDALVEAGRTGCDLVIAHEKLYYPRQGEPPGWETWRTNRQRTELLDGHNLVLLRAHGSLDDICILDDFARMLGLGGPVVAHGLAKVYELAPCTLEELVQRVKREVGLNAVRVSAPGGLRQVVRRVGLPWGGLGLFTNVGYQQQLVELGCDVFIAGESDNYGFRFSAECGIPMIETSHEVSENPGLQHWARILGERFPELQVSYYECGLIWQMC